MRESRTSDWFGLRCVARSLVRMLAVVACAASFAGSPCGAQEEFEPVQASALAWWRLSAPADEERASEGARRLVEAVARASSGLTGEPDAAEVLGALVVAGAIASSSHQFAVLDLASTDEEGVARLAMFRGVLEIRGDHASLARTLLGVLGEGSLRRPIALPGGRDGEALRRDAWPAWLEVSWTSGAGVFYVGIGRGSLEAWLTEGAEPEPAWAAHEAMVDARRGGSEVFAAFMDLDGLRRAAPAWFGRETPGRLLGAWGLANGRAFMAHGRLVNASRVRSTGEGAYEGPSLLVVDATWESRREAPGTVHHREVTSPMWPGREVEMDPPPGRFVMAVRLRTLAWIQRGVGTHMAMLDDPAAFLRDVRRWARRTQGRISRLERTSSPFLIVGEGAGLGSLHLEIDRGVDPAAYERELGRVMSTLGEAVVFDEGSRTWSARMPGWPSELWWGVSDGVLVAGWRGEE